MAIQEFSSGPQNYFEAGYFNGDYTEPNVSRAGLACQASCIKGFSISSQNYFETGYFVEDYIESNVIKAGFACEPDYIVGFQISFGLYFVEGYLDEIYFYDNTSEFTVSAQASATKSFAVSATGYYEQDYFVDDYFQSRGAAADLSCAATRIISNSANLASVWSQTATASGITKQSFVSLTTAVAQTTVASKTVDAGAAFVAAFAPTLTASALKNQTAIVAAVITMSTAASVTRSTNVLLEHIADLNAMAAMSVGLSASLSISATQTTSAVSIPGISITASSTATLSCAASRIQPVSATISAVSGLTTSRYFGKNRPRNIVDYNDNPYFNFFNSGLAGGQGISTGATSPVIFAGPLSDISPGANESWVLTFTYNNDSTTTARSFFYSFLNGSGSERFLRLATTNTAGTGFQLNLFKTGQSTVTQTFTTSGSTTKIAISYHNGYAAVFLDGQRQALINLTATTGVTWTGFNELIQTRWSLGANTSIDEFHYSRGTFLEYNPQSTSVTATNLQTNQAATTEVLWHFNGNGLDDITVTESASAALTSAFTQQTIGSGTFVPRSAQASLQTTATVVAQGNRPVSVSANLATASTLSVVIGSVKDSIALNAGAFTVTTQESRLRGVTSSITSAFAPTMNAQATKVGDIALSTVFAMSTTATSFTDSTADIAAVFAVSATANGIQRQGGSALSSQFNQATVIGKLQSVNVPITSAFSTVMNVIQIEGVVANLQSTFAVNSTVTRLPGIILTLPSNFTTLITAFNAVHDTEQNRIYSYDVWHFNSAGEQQPYEGDELVGNFSEEESKFGDDAVRALTGVGWPGYHEGLDAFEAINQQLAYAPGRFSTLPNFTVDFWIKLQKPSAGTPVWNTVILQVFNFLLTFQVYRSTSDNLGTYRIGKYGPGDVIVESVQGTGNNGGYTNSFQTGVYAGIANNWEHIAIQRKDGYIQLYIGGVYKGQMSDSTPGYGYQNTIQFQATSDAIDELRIDTQTAYYSGNFSPPTVAYADPTPRFYGFKRNGYAILEPRVTMQIIGFSIVTLTTPATFSTTAVSTITANQTARPTVNALVTSSLVTNAGKNVEIGSALASQSAISVNAFKVTRTSADLNVVGAQSTANDRIRTTTAALATTATVSVDAVKRTGIVLSLNTAATQSVTGFRIQQGQSSISALYSQLIVAFQNATGTVLLETVTAMQITAEKNAVGVIALPAQFTQTTNTANSKTVRMSSALAAQVTVTADGLRIQPAGANLSAVATQTTNTDQSKTTRVTAAFVTAVTTTATAARTRSTPSTLSAVASMVCNNIVLREANANFTDSFDVLCSVQYIIRITATFSAFNSQLTVGEIINIDPALQLMIEPETRIRKIQQETRVLSIESETRVNIIED